jgi:hypothetical protein
MQRNPYLADLGAREPLFQAAVRELVNASI